MSDNEPTIEAAKGSVSYTTLILAIVITAIVSAGSVLAIVYLPGDGDLLEQEGMFDSFPDQEGQVYFPYPFSSPPNVTLTRTSNPTVTVHTLLVEVTPTGFKWKGGKHADGQLTAR